MTSTDVRPDPAAEWWRLARDELCRQLETIEERKRRDEALQGQILAEISSRGVMAEYGVATLDAFQQQLLRISKREASKRSARALALNETREGTTVRAPVAPHTAAAAAAGQIGAEHVDAITRILNHIPATIPGEDREAYEHILVDVARHAGPAIVNRAGRHLIARLDQDGSPPTDDAAARPERELRYAWTRGNRFSFEAELDAETGHLLENLLSPLSKPTPADNGDRDDRSPAQRNGDALAELLEFTHRAVQLPTEAGEKPHVLITLDYHQLMRDHHAAQQAAPQDADEQHAAQQDTQAAHAAQQDTDDGHNDPEPADAAAQPTDPDPVREPTPEPQPTPTPEREPIPGPQPIPEALTGPGGARLPARRSLADLLGDTPPLLNWETPLTAEQARRWACDCVVIPAVLGTTSELLDLGRTERVVTPAQRRALNLRDQGCSFPGCTRPPRWCQAHHIRTTSGTTSGTGSTAHHRPQQPRPRLCRTPPAHPPQRLERPHRHRRPTRMATPHLARPPPTPQTQPHPPPRTPPRPSREQPPLDQQR